MDRKEVITSIIIIAFVSITGGAAYYDVEIEGFKKWKVVSKDYVIKPDNSIDYVINLQKHDKEKGRVSRRWYVEQDVYRDVKNGETVVLAKEELTGVIGRN